MERTKDLLSYQNIASYVDGCGDIATKLDDAITAVRNARKIPTILIPSRGALPITLIGVSMLGEIDPTHVLLDKSRTRYYPDKIFEYLSEGRIAQNGSHEPEVEVVLYPFTADVTEEGKEEYLANRFRYSATRAFIDLVTGDRSSLDLNWYYFLMSRMQSDAFHDSDLNPASIVKSLNDIVPTRERQIILIDTVISGRASSQIVNAFYELGHPVIPILAVDNSGGAKVQDRFRAEINKKSVWAEFMNGPHADGFIEFPLITEDMGAALLGVTAINFTDFNENGVFNDVDCRIPTDFLPQSCIWTLPPRYHSLRNIYSKAFYEFLDVALNPDCIHEDWSRTKALIKSLVKSHHGVDLKELQGLVIVDRGGSAKESSSHIISVHLPERQVYDWIKKFSGCI